MESAIFKLNFEQKKIIIRFLSQSNNFYDKETEIISIECNNTKIHCALYVEKFEKISNNSNLNVTVKELNFFNKLNFYKRDHKMHEHEIIISELIYRAIKATISTNYFFPININISILSNDHSIAIDFLSILGAICSLNLYGIPTKEMIGVCKIGQYKQDSNFKLILDNVEDLYSSFLLIGSDNYFTEIEFEGQEITTTNLIQGLEFGKKQLKETINKLQSFFNEVKKFYSNKNSDFSYKIDEKFNNLTKNKLIEDLTEKIIENFESSVDYLKLEQENELKRNAVKKKTNKINTNSLDIDIDFYQNYRKITDQEIKNFIINYIHKTKFKNNFDNLIDFDDLVEFIFSKTKFHYINQIIFDYIKHIGKSNFKNLNLDIHFLPQCHGSSMFNKNNNTCFSFVTLSSQADHTNFSTSGHLNSNQLLTPTNVDKNDNLNEILESKKTKTFKKKPNLHVMFEIQNQPDNLWQLKKKNIEAVNIISKSFKPVLSSDFTHNILVHISCFDQKKSNFTNGVCATSLSLMDAGVNIKNHLAGVNINLVRNFQENHMEEILIDVSNLSEKFFTNNKCNLQLVGSKDGFTFMKFQTIYQRISILDLQKAIIYGFKEIKYIVDILNKKIAAPNENLKFLPSAMKNIQIPPEYIGKLIGIGGKNIKELIAELDIKLDINKNGHIKIYGEKNNIKQAILNINQTISPGKVIDLTNFSENQDSDKNQREVYSNEFSENDGEQYNKNTNENKSFNKQNVKNIEFAQISKSNTLSKQKAQNINEYNDSNKEKDLKKQIINKINDKKDKKLSNDPVLENKFLETEKKDFFF